MPPPRTLPTIREAGEWTPEREPADKKVHLEPSGPVLAPSPSALHVEDVSMTVPIFPPQVRTAEEEEFTPDRTHSEKKVHVEASDNEDELVISEPALPGVTRLSSPDPGSDPESTG
jgi:hypothetical protein